MPGIKRSQASVSGGQLAAHAAIRQGATVRAVRKRRRTTQAVLARQVGISRARLADIEAGRGAGVPLEVWFALGEALGIYLRFEFGRDPQADVRDAGHLAIQELVLRVARHGGWSGGGFEVPTRPADPARSVDVPLIDRARRRLAIVECWNTFGDLGAAARSDNRKLAEAQQVAVALGGDAGEYEVGLCWVVRDTAANRELVRRYEHVFASRFAGSSQGWVDALTEGGPLPDQPGLIWCDVSAARLFARRRARSAA